MAKNKWGIDVPEPLFTEEEQALMHSARIKKNQDVRDRAKENNHSVLGEMGFCERCGKSVSSGGTWINGKFYGPDCKNKIAKE